MACYDDEMTIEDRLHTLSMLSMSLRVEDYRIKIITWQPLRFSIIARQHTRGLQDTVPYPQYKDDLIFTTENYDMLPSVPFGEDAFTNTSQDSSSNFGADLSEEDFAAIHQEAHQRKLEWRARHPFEMVQFHDKRLSHQGFERKEGAEAMVRIKDWRHSLLVDYSRFLGGTNGDRCCVRVKRVILSIQRELRASMVLARESGERNLKSFAVLEKGCSDVTHLARDMIKRLRRNGFSPDAQMVARLVSARGALRRTIQTIKIHLQTPDVSDQGSGSEREPLMEIGKPVPGEVVDGKEEL